MNTCTKMNSTFFSSFVRENELHSIFTLPTDVSLKLCYDVQHQIPILIDIYRVSTIGNMGTPPICKCGCRKLKDEVYWHYEQNVLTEEIIMTIESKFRFTKLNKDSGMRHIPHYIVAYINIQYYNSNSIKFKKTGWFFEFDGIDFDAHNKHLCVLKMIQIIKTHNNEGDMGDSIHRLLDLTQEYHTCHSSSITNR